VLLAGDVLLVGAVVVGAVVGGTVVGGTVVGGTVVGGTVVGGTVVGGTVVGGTVVPPLVWQTIRMTKPPENTKSSPIRSDAVTVLPSVSGPSASVRTRGARSTSSIVTEELPDAAIRSLFGCTDRWFPDIAATGQVNPTASGGTGTVSSS
jgi:hypothetical protein